MNGTGVHLESQTCRDRPRPHVDDRIERRRDVLALRVAGHIPVVPAACLGQLARQRRIGRRVHAQDADAPAIGALRFLLRHPDQATLIGDLGVGDDQDMPRETTTCPGALQCLFERNTQLRASRVPVRLEELDGVGTRSLVHATSRPVPPRRRVVKHPQAQAVTLGQHANQALDGPVGGFPLGTFHRSGVVDQHRELPGHNLLLAR